MRQRKKDLAPVDVSEDALEKLQKWSRDDRRKFAELLEDAASDVQREMMQRALVAGREIAELHAFGDAIRPMTDEEVYDACTLSFESGLHDSVVAHLRAQADPLYAFAANGHALSPDDEPRRAQVRHVPAQLLVPPEVPKVLPYKRGFESESGEGRVRRADVQDLGASPDDPPTVGVGVKVAEDLLNLSVRGLGVRFGERAVDVPSFRLEQALQLAAAALRRGIPVPVVLGGTPGQYLRYGLLLQVQPTGASRAYQLHDPTDDETVWVNEGDFVNRTELPLSNKKLRRITAIALPTP